MTLPSTATSAVPVVDYQVRACRAARTKSIGSERAVHTHPFNSPFPGLPRWAGTRKVKPIWILLKQETVSGSGISWAICKSTLLQTDNHASTPLLSFYRPDALPATQPTASKHWESSSCLKYNFIPSDICQANMDLPIPPVFLLHLFWKRIFIDNRIPARPWKYLNSKAANSRPQKVLEYDLLLLENVDWITESCSFELFATLLWIPVTLLCFLLTTYFKLKSTVL